MREAEEEIDVDEDDAAVGSPHAETSIPLRNLEEGGRFSPTHHRFNSGSLGKGKGKARSPSPKGRASASLQKRLAQAGNDFKRTCRNLLGPVLAQSFILTFLGEWGDRSQIATIALAAAHVRSPS